MTCFHIIPDVHGQADKLDALLDLLGWRRTATGWRGPEPDRRILFLGDFIDRGPENDRVLSKVRSLIDSGKADAVMGNHEFNAIHFHSIGPEGKPLRDHSTKNVKQHASFLKEFPLGNPRTVEAVNWMMTLPLYLDLTHLRIVHACWYQPAIDRIASNMQGAKLTDEIIQAPGWKSGALWEALQIVTSGIEEPLPDGHSFYDKDGTERHEVRIGWWLEGAESWRDIARSVPDLSALPRTELPKKTASYLYEDQVPVFFGHYWMTGAPNVEAPYALCLDYSAGKGGPLLAYNWTPGATENDLRRIVMGPS